MKSKGLTILLVIPALLTMISLPVFANSPPGGGGSSDMLTLLVYAVIAFCGLLLTVVLELLTVFFFGKCAKYAGDVALTNVTSQILMHIAYLLICALVRIDRLFLIVILEILVYLGEYLVYRKKMDEAPKSLVLIYTLVANTISLVAGAALFGGLSL